LVWALVIASIFQVALASAHTVGLSQSDFAMAPDGTVRARLVFSKADAARLGRLDREHDGVLATSEAEAFRQALAKGVVVRADGAACPPEVQGGGDAEGDGVGLSIVFTCPSHATRLDVELPLLDGLPAGHRHVLRLSTAQGSVDKLLAGADRAASLTLEPGPGAGATSVRHEAGGSTFVGALELGVEHILTGWDHLLFLAALLLGTRELRGVVAAVSAFTVAHSITLAVAALGIYAPGPRWVEPAIAASIAFVAFQNVLQARPAHRWRVTFAFGLIHGFGFAGALQELTLARERLVPTLLGFNLGVEAGQLVLVALAVPVLARLRRRASFEDPWVRRTSFAMGIVGAALCVFRIASP